MAEGETFSELFLRETAEVAARISSDAIEEMARELASLKGRGGRLFVLGVGGGAGHASHSVNDFRKLCEIEAYAPTDNVSELTARTNDDGWETSFSEWLRTSRLNRDDALMIFSVGGGSRERNVSVNIVNAIDLAAEVEAPILAIVGKSDGAAARAATAAVVVPAPGERLTPHVESFQAVVWHLLVSHPRIAAQRGKWEILEAGATP